VGKHAATALQAIGGPAVEPLIGVIHDQTSSVRVQAVGVLGRLGDARAIEPLIGVLKDDDDWRVREAAAGGVRGFEVSMVEPLIGVLHDLNPSVRLQAVRTLADLGDARAVEPLIGVLQDDGDWRVSYAAEEALRRLGGTRAVQALLDRYVNYLVIKLGDVDQLGSAQKALQAIGAPAVEPLLAVLNGDDGWYARRAAVRALGEIGDARAVDPLCVTLCYDDNHIVREAALEALQAIGPPAVEALTGALREKIEPLLALLDDEEESGYALDELVPALELSSQDVDADLLRKIVRLGDHVEFFPDYRRAAQRRGCLFDAQDVSCSQVKQLARQELIRRGLQA
jgi:HEAT repeat protein